MKRAVLLLLAACAHSTSPPRDNAAPVVVAPTVPVPPLPDYLVRLASSGEVQTRGDNGEILASRADDNEVLRGYSKWKELGPLVGKASERLTIMTAKSEYAAGEDIRVIHVHEAEAAGTELCVMGPKGIYGEFIDGALVSRSADIPPLPYDGRVLASPNEDHNYEVTVYRLPRGEHAIQWRSATECSPTELRSNVLLLHVR